MTRIDILFWLCMLAVGVVVPSIDRGADHAETWATSRGRLCVAAVVFNEARGEGLPGQVEVARVLFNRARDGKQWPTDICMVAAEFAQFESLDPDRPPWKDDPEAWQWALYAADLVAYDEGGMQGCAGSTYFYSGPPPEWAKSMQVVCTVGRHTLLRQP